MIRLYIKTHRKTGLKYLGKTTAADPHLYHGSGKYWKLHLKKHGYDYDTEIIFESENIAEIKEKGIYFSRLYNVVSSNEWANLKEEQGDGGSMNHSPESNKKRSDTLKGRTFTKEHCENLSKSQIGHPDYRTLETKAAAAIKASAKLKGKKKPPGFAEAVGNRMRGSKMSDSARENMKATWTKEKRKAQSDRTRQQNANRSIITCPHCNLQGTNPGNMSRYHFDNCHLIKPKIPKLRKIAARALEWHLLSPTRETIIVTNMRAFCRENNLNNGTMSEVALGNRKQHKGWRVISVVRDDDTCS